ncbi:MAG: 5'-methylthioadenosine/adenosylhomocysteine nucleosidase [Clostridia bacterium]|nr:5'-methylthioadenosine/adenosylhomocysteine nucleosidase [Clostridia bacterium]
MSSLIGIIGAMDIEVNGLISDMEGSVTEIHGGISFTKGILYGKNVVVSKCGIGKVFASMCTQTMILKYSPDLIINSGVAGTLDKELNILDAVIASSVVQHDMDTSPLGDPKGLISGINVVNFDTDKDISCKLANASSDMGVNTVSGIIASGDQFIASPDKKADIFNTFGAIACEMEGAAIGQVCYVNQVPFTVMRTISDGKGEALDYHAFSVIAANKSMQIIKQFLLNY